MASMVTFQLFSNVILQLHEIESAAQHARKVISQVSK